MGGPEVSRACLGAATLVAVLATALPLAPTQAEESPLVGAARTDDVASRTVRVPVPDGVPAERAVLAGGLSRIYPPEHAELAEQVVARGALLTETPMTVAPQPGMFPARNRIISALSRAVVIVEAGERSGALITATHAAGQHIAIVASQGEDGLRDERVLRHAHLRRHQFQRVPQVRRQRNRLGLRH